MKTRQELIREREDEISRICEQVREEMRSPESAIGELTSRFSMTEFAANQILHDWPEILKRRRER